MFMSYDVFKRGM